MAEEDTVRVLARDGEEFLWSRDKARRATTLANMMDEASDDTLPVFGTRSHTPSPASTT